MDAYQWTRFIIEWLVLLMLYQVSETSIHLVNSSLRTLPTRKERTIALIMPAIARGIKSAILITVFRSLLYSFYQPSAWLPEKETLYHFSIILGISWFCLQLIRSAERIFTLRYSHLDEDLDSRKTYTHILLFKRVAMILLAALTAAALLMSVQDVRNLGKGILISTGIATAIFSISSKQPLEGLMRGIQLAITQSIRLNDTIIVEGELGVVSAINLTHVIVTLWDKRQMIVPTHYFLERPFQNWTHASKDLIGTIFFYVDYQLPIEPIRQKFYEYLESNELGLWNGNAKLLQVTAIKNNQVELRMLVSADDPEKLFDLSCDIREKMLYTIQQSYPEGWPKIRIESLPIKSSESSV
jgi:small-conductance mechanosensitive channel